MTTRQQKRLEAAERVCEIVSRDYTTMFHEKGQFAYTPEAVKLFREAQWRFLDELKSRGEEPNLDDIGWLKHLPDQLQAAIVAWLEACGVEPATRAYSEMQRNAMELARDAFGVGYEGEVDFTDEHCQGLATVKRSEQRAAGVVAEFGAGKIRTHHELELAIAAEILEAERAAREPFLDAVSGLDEVVSGERGPGGEPGEEAKAWLMKAMSKLAFQSQVYLSLRMVKRGASTTECTASECGGLTA